MRENLSLEEHTKELMKKTESVFIENTNIVVYKLACPHCGKVITGFSPGQIRFNIKNHLRYKHPELVQSVR